MVLREPGRPRIEAVMRTIRIGLVLAVGARAQHWEMQESGTTASMRAVSAVSARSVWAGGTGGTFLHTSDGGLTWKAFTVPGAEKLDFRGIHAVDDRTVFLMSAGTGDQSRVYKTTDGGAHWTLVFANPDAKGFFDAITFWDARHGLILGDPVDGQFAVFTTADGGAHWVRQKTPAAIEGEGAFAASNSCLAVRGKSEAWFGTGGARVFHSIDRGRTWEVVETPVRHNAASAGVFSVAIADGRWGVAVGGDYAKDRESARGLAITTDGGRTWVAPEGELAGFRSAVVYESGSKMWIATGTSGSDISKDGRVWRNFDGGAFHALAAKDGVVWAVGPRGRIAVLRE